MMRGGSCVRALPPEILGGRRHRETEMYIFYPLIACHRWRPTHAQQVLHGRLKYKHPANPCHSKTWRLAQQVHGFQVPEGLLQQSLTPNTIEGSQQQHAQAPLGGNRQPPGARAHHIKLGPQRFHHGSDHQQNATQGMMLWDAFRRRDGAERSCLLVVISIHGLILRENIQERAGSLSRRTDFSREQEWRFSAACQNTSSENKPDTWKGQTT
jgi:hypothetical protein